MEDQIEGIPITLSLMLLLNQDYHGYEQDPDGLNYR